MTGRPFPELMTPGEVAQVFRVDPYTVTRWAKDGKLRSIRTLSTGAGPGHRRFYSVQVAALLAGVTLTDDELDAAIRGES